MRLARPTAIFLLASICGGLAGAMLVGVVGNHVDRSARADARLERIVRRLDGIDAALATLSARVDSAERHLTGSVRVAHDRRKALADELRREASSAVDRLTLQVAGLGENVVELRKRAESEVVIRGQQILAERSDRRKEVALIVDELTRVAWGQVAANGRLADRLATAEDRIEALESRPAPEPVVVEKVTRQVVQVPVYLPIAPAPVPSCWPVPIRRCR